MVTALSFVILRQSLKHQSLVKSQLKHRDIVSSLCEDTLCSFQAGLQLAEQAAQAGAQVLNRVGLGGSLHFGGCYFVSFAFAPLPVCERGLQPMITST